MWRFVISSRLSFFTCQSVLLLFTWMIFPEFSYDLRTRVDQILACSRDIGITLILGICWRLFLIWSWQLARETSPRLRGIFCVLVRRRSHIFRPRLACSVEYILRLRFICWLVLRGTSWVGWWHTWHGPRRSNWSLLLHYYLHRSALMATGNH